MDADTVFFVEKDVCDGSAWSLKWGTLILYRNGLVFYYNRPRKGSDRMQDMIKIEDIQEVKTQKIDWLVSKIFWVGRQLVIVKTREGEKKYYLRNTDNLFMAFEMLRPSIKLGKG